jgi:uncharacterized membrane protein YgaE (UPF0421/DUF939 family)
MKEPSTRWNILGLCYSITLLLTVGIIIMGAKILNIPDVTWALISGVVCTEIEIGQVYSLMFLRIVSTLVGAATGCLVLLILGSGYFSIMAGVMVTTLTCYYVFNLQRNWKLATATSIMVLIAGTAHGSISTAELLAFKRTIEVISGSIIAVIVSFFLRKLWSTIKII